MGAYKLTETKTGMVCTGGIRARNVVLTSGAIERSTLQNGSHIFAHFCYKLTFKKP